MALIRFCEVRPVVEGPSGTRELSRGRRLGRTEMTRRAVERLHGAIWAKVALWARLAFTLASLILECSGMARFRTAIPSSTETSHTALEH